MIKQKSKKVRLKKLKQEILNNKIIKRYKVHLNTKKENKDNKVTLS